MRPDDWVTFSVWLKPWCVSVWVPCAVLEPLTGRLAIGWIGFLRVNFNEFHSLGGTETPTDYWLTPLGGLLRWGHRRSLSINGHARDVSAEWFIQFLEW